MVALLAGVLVARSAGQRNAGDTISGGVRQSTRDDLLSARQKLATQDWDGAIQIYDSVLADDPAVQMLLHLQQFLGLARAPPSEQRTRFLQHQ